MAIKRALSQTGTGGIQDPGPNRSSPFQWSVRFIDWLDHHPRMHWSLLGVCLAIVAIAAVSPWYQIQMRDQASWPHHTVFLVKKGALPERGELVAFRMRQVYVDRIHPQGRPRPQIPVGNVWMKRVMGMPGDRVEVHGTQVFINEHLIAEGFGRDRFGTPIELAPFAGPIAQGEYYVALPHPKSFDSRYYGTISQADVIGVVTPLF